MNSESPSFILFHLFTALSLPLASSVVCMFIRARIAWLSPIISSILMIASVTTCIIIFVHLFPNTEFEYAWTWFSTGDQTIHASLLLNDLSVTMLVMIAIISSLIHIYSIGYMIGDAKISRYFALLGFFTFAMFGLVISGNLLLLYCFWELVGVASYLLIGHRRERPKAVRSATKAFLFNRIGDAGLLLGLMMIWSHTGSFELTTLSTLISTDEPWTTYAGLCIFLGAVGKSAQFPLLTWLPDAMEGPTPVSALIHAATMVAAGIFLLLRIPFIFNESTLLVIACIGSITAIYGAVSALNQFDLKKILAYSTISQLGIMMIGIGTNAWQGALLHLLAHAFFKACLFIGAGAIIHSLHQAQALSQRAEFDPQDIRNMGGLRKLMPIAFFTFALAAASLGGLPFSSGFLSKEAILISMIRIAVENQGLIQWVFISCFMLTSLLTVLYTYRLVTMVFFGDFTMKEKVQPFIPTAPIMLWPMVILAACSLWFFFSFNPWGFKSWITHDPHSTAMPYLDQVTVFSLLWVGLSLALAWWIYTRQKLAAYLFTFPLSLDGIYEFLFLKPVLFISETLETFDKKGIDKFIHGFTYTQVSLAFVVSWIDRNLIDGLVIVFSHVTGFAGNMIRSVGGGKIQSYILWATAALIIFTFWQLK